MLTECHIEQDPCRAESRELLSRFGWMTRVRPGVLGGFLLKLSAPVTPRRILTTDPGVRLYVDPFSHLGREVISTGTYEAENVAVFREEIGPGSKVLDVGANEGFFSALAGALAGDSGFVAAVEPQARLQDLIEINFRINGVANFKVFRNAVGGGDGQTARLNLYPAWNTGASSLVNGYRFSRSSQVVSFISVPQIFEHCGLDRFDFVKVDVEGFESGVVEALTPSIRAGRVRKLFLDYHARILARRQVDAWDIHKSLIESGMTPRHGTPPHLESYVLYDYRG